LTNKNHAKYIFTVATSLLALVPPALGFSPLGLALSEDKQFPSSPKSNVYGLSLSLVGEQRNDVYGINLSMFLPKIENNMTGIQIAPVNYAKYTHGVQIGIFALVQEMNGIGIAILGGFNMRFKGLQISGLFGDSFGEPESYNLQIAGLGNSYGLQIAGLGNSYGLYDTKDGNDAWRLDASSSVIYGGQIALLANGASAIRGFQASIGFNYAHKFCQGVQLGIYNYAEKLRGLQIGVVNVAKSGKGVQIGLANAFGTDGDRLILPFANFKF